MTAGAVVILVAWGHGTALDVRGPNADIYFPRLESTGGVPLRTVQLAAPQLSLAEPSADLPEEPHRWGVYVVELRDTAPLPPRPDLTKPYLYVGVSQNSASHRFKIHKEGGPTASGLVYTFGLWLRPGLFRQYERV